MASRSGPIALPTEPATPDANAVPGQPAPRPIAGPILPLVASSVGTDQLLGGPGSRPAAVDALAARTLVKGEPLAAPAGRADDFAWPRREIGREQAKEVAKEQGKGESPCRVDRAKRIGAGRRVEPPKPKKQFRPVSDRHSRALRDFFGGFGTTPQPRQIAPQRRAHRDRQRLPRRACRGRRVMWVERPKHRPAHSRDNVILVALASWFETREDALLTMRV